MAGFDPDKFMSGQAAFDPDEFMTPPKAGGPQPMPTLKPGLHAGVTATGAPVGFSEFKPPVPQPKFVNPLTGNPLSNQSQNPNFSDSSTAGKVSNDLYDTAIRDRDTKTGKPLTAEQRMNSATKAVKDIATSPAMIPALGIATAGAPLIPTLGRAVAGAMGAGVTGLGAKEAVKLSGGTPAEQDAAQLVGEGAGGYVGDKALPEAAAKLKGWGTQLLNPVQALGTALPGYKPTNSTATAADQAMKHIRDMSVQGPNLPGATGDNEPITHIGVLKNMAKAASSKMQAAYDQWIDRADQAGIKLNPWPTIRDAFMEAIASGSEADTHPEIVQDNLARLQNAYDKPMTMREVDALRSKTGMSNFYNRTTGDKAKDLAQDKDAALDATIRNALNDTVYRLLDPQGNGLGPRTIKQIQGQAIQIRDASEAHEDKAFLEPALTRLQGAAMGVRNTYRQLSPWSHPNAAEASPFKGKTNALIEKVFGELEGAPQPLPLPQGPYGGSAPIRGFLPPASSGIGVSGVTVPDILGRSNRGPGAQGLLPAPAPGEPPVNILPNGMPPVGTSRAATLQRLRAGGFPATGASGPAGSVPILGSEAPIALPGEIGGRIQDIPAPHLNFGVERDQTNPLMRNMPGDPITIRTPDGRYHTVSKHDLESKFKNEHRMTKAQIDKALDFMISGGRVPLALPEAKK